MARITKNMSLHQAIVTLAQGNSEADGILASAINYLNTDKQRRRLLEICDEYDIVGELVCSLYAVCDEHDALFRLILTMETNHRTTFNVTRRIKNPSNARELKRAFHSDPFVKEAKMTLVNLF